MVDKQGLISYLQSNGGRGEKSWQEVGKEFGFTAEAARSIYRRSKKSFRSKTHTSEQHTSSYREDRDNKKAEYSFKTSSRITSLEDLIKACDIDLTAWEIERWECNKWEIGRKNKTVHIQWDKGSASGNVHDKGNITVEPLFQIKVWLRAKKPSHEEIFERVFRNYKTPYIPIKKKDILLSEKNKGRNMVQISLLDFHLDKRTREYKSLDERAKEYQSVVTSLITKCHLSYYVDKIVYIVGEDFFHSDSMHGSTTKGTPLEISDYWDTAYEVGFDLHVRVINILRQFCNTLEIILIQGNHDRMKSYYMAHGLEMYFKPDENIIFKRSSDNMKHTVYGVTFIGYHHGNCKIEELPIIFASSPISSFDYGSSIYREIHVGDKHTYMEKEIKGTNVRIKRLPSLSGDDTWHVDNNFVNHIKAGIALVYDIAYGRVAEFEERIEI